MFAGYHLPRATGDVRAAFEVMVRSAPLPMRPRRIIELGRKVDPAELRTVNVRDSVLLCEPLVDECVIRRQEVDNAPILAGNATEK